MIVFDSINDKKWYGSEFDLNLKTRNAFIIKSNTNIKHEVKIAPGMYTLHILGRKRSGDGKIIVNLISDNGSLLFAENIELNRTSAMEFKYEFNIPFEYDKCYIAISRAKGAFGSVQIDRIRLAISDTSKSAKRIEDVLALKNNKINSIDNLDYKPIKSKIVFIIPYGIYGGAEIYLQSIIENINIGDFNIELIYLARNKLMNFIQDPRIKSRLCRNLDSLKGSLISGNYDYVVYYNRADVYRLIELMKDTNQLQSKIIEIYHSDFEWPGAVSKIKERRFVDLMIRTTPFIGNDISGISEDKKATVPIGIDITKFKFANFDQSIRQNLKGDRDGVIGTVARLSPEKNLEYVLELAGKMKNYSFVIIGEGPLLSKLSGIIIDENLNNVSLMGFQKDIHKYLPAFDAFLLTSKIEGTPISILEAMSSEVVVFSSKVGAIPAIIREDERTGFFISGVPAKDRKLIIDNISRADVIANAKKMVDNEYEIKSNAAEFMRAIIDLERRFVVIDDNHNNHYVLKGRFI